MTGYLKRGKNLGTMLLLAVLGWTSCQDVSAVEARQQEKKAAAGKPEKLFVATPLTEKNKFTGGIEGPACDAAGNVYAVNFARQSTVGRVASNGKSELFVDLPKGKYG